MQEDCIPCRLLCALSPIPYLMGLVWSAVLKRVSVLSDTERFSTSSQTSEDKFWLTWTVVQLLMGQKYRQNWIWQNISTSSPVFKNSYTEVIHLFASQIKHITRAKLQFAALWIQYIHIVRHNYIYCDDFVENYSFMQFVQLLNYDS